MYGIWIILLFGVLPIALALWFAWMRGWQGGGGAPGGRD